MQRKLKVWDRLPLWTKALGRKVSRWKNVLIVTGVVCFLISVSIFIHFYVEFSSEIDARLSGQVFNRASLVFSAPAPIETGERATPEELAARLRRALVSPRVKPGPRWEPIQPVEGDRLENSARIRSPTSLLRLSFEGAATVEFKGGRISSIKVDGQDEVADQYLLEPEPVTTLFDASRTKRGG